MMSTNGQYQNLNQAILAALEIHAPRVCLKFKSGEHFRNITYRQMGALILHMARFLQQQGVANGERVAIVMSNSLEWLVLYLGTLVAGGVAVPLHPSIAPDTLRFVLHDSGAHAVALASQMLYHMVVGQLGPKSPKPWPDLQTILITASIEPDQRGHTVALATILNETVPLRRQERRDLCTYAESTAPETLASIHYTGGETGRLKGAVFDHRRLVQTMQHLAASLPLAEDDLAFTVLPWSHPTSLHMALHYFFAGLPNVLSESDDAAVVETMQQTSPTVTLNMPYFYERFYQYVMNDIGRQPESTQKVFQWAIAKGKEYLAAGKHAPARLRQEYIRADLTFFNQIRGYIGGRMRRLYMTGGSPPPELADFFEAIGLPILNLYSLAEVGGFPFVSQPNDRRPGSCGRLAPGFECRLADDGEILIRSETTMCEYWGWPADMQQTLDAAGWLHTGDLGQLDGAGFLFLTGRKQPLMLLTTGRRILPSAIEAALQASPFIEQAVVFGEGRPYVTALMVPNLQALADHFSDTEALAGQLLQSNAPARTINWFWKQGDADSGLMATTAHPKVQALLDKVIAEVNRQLDRWEQIREYGLLEQAGSKTAHELAETVRVGRHLVAERYAAAIEPMYPQTQPVQLTTISQVKVPPERLRELLEKETILDAWLADAGIEFLFDLARSKQIDSPSMVYICDAAATIAQMEQEEKSLSTALIVGDPVRISRVLPESQIRLLRHDHIRRMRSQIISLAKLVDGLVLGYVVDRHGYVRGIHKLTVELEAQAVNFLLGPQFRHHAAISQLCDAVVFFVPSGGNQVRVFADGQLAGRYSNGDWSPESISRVEGVISQLVKQKKYNPTLIRRLLRCAFQMSEENTGAIFIIGHAETVLKLADAPQISHFALLVSDELDNMTDRELINFAKQDGATLVDVAGKFRGCMVLLRPDAGTKAEIGAGKGARHSSAAKMSAEAACLAITVSQDGPITLYESGRRVLSL